jgi:hypothetical protein
MKVAEHVYISEILKPEKEFLKKRIRQKKKIPALYCITLPLWKSGILEIYSYNELISDFYEKEEIVVVGLAAGRDDALVLLRRMADDLAADDALGNVDHYFCGE